MTGPTAPGGWGAPGGPGDEAPREQAPRDPWASPPDERAPRDPWASPPEPQRSGASPWGAPEPPRPHGAEQHPPQPHEQHPAEQGWPAQSWPPPPQGAGQDPSWQQWPPPAPARRRSGRTARLLGAGSAVLLLGVAGGFAGALLQERSQGTGPYPAVAVADPEPGSTVRPAGSVAEIARTALPSVVALQVEGSGGSGTGSGFVLQTEAADASEAFVLTNNHVVAGAYDDGVTVVFQDGAQVPGRVVGADASYDLAVVRVEREGLRPLALGDSASVVVGDRVVAVGAPLGLQGTVTEGIVSALNRPVSAGGRGAEEASYIQAIQTDAAINPGNSGGPLLNDRGEVVGVNSAIAALPGAQGGGTAGSIGLGFSIPSAQAGRTAEQLIRTGRAVHPVIRVSLDSQYRGEGVQVLDQPGAVESGGPADRAGLRPGDVVLAVDGRPVTEAAELIVDIRARQPGDTVTLTVRRGGQDLQVPVTLEADG
ncbi:trypsin-like peptidase domain-containing protein [Kineococcus gypseus]|uniref:S1C family serine protease n=1 Tax=Kineococcus gypseus TaxID=1637102 RepID=UPI003D7C4A8D